jgi:hypothetical protein
LRFLHFAAPLKQSALVGEAPRQVQPTAESSAAAVFADRCVYLTDRHGITHPYDHHRQLTEAEQRIARAIAKAKEQQHLSDPNLAISEAQADLPLHPLRRAFLRPVPLLLDRLKVATAPL